MSEKKGNLSRNLTVLVFKDRFAARTFQVPLAWIYRIGIGIGVLALVTLLSAFLAVKYYRESRLASPGRLHDLELELQDLKNSIMVAGGGSVTVTPSPSPAPSALANAEAVPESPQTPTAPSFSQLFPNARMADPATVPITIHSPRVAWEGKSLSVNFAIQYHREDGGNQQGRIVVLVRGPESLLAYPAGVLTLSGHGPFVLAGNGEFFSVSRFREVRATFGPVADKSSLKEVEIYLFGTDGSILVYQNIPVGP